MTHVDRLPRVMTWVGILFALLLPVGVALLLAAQPGDPAPATVEIPRFVALGALALLPPGIAWAGLRYRRRALLATAAAVAAALGMVLVPFGLLLWVSVIAWAQAASRIPGLQREQRRVPVPVLLAVPPLLAVAAGVALFVHQDPACWRYEEDADGQRTYEQVDVGDRYPSGFGFPGLVQTGEETSDAVGIDPDTGEPLDPGVAVAGHTCVSDRVTVPQMGVSLLLTASGALVAVRAGRPRSADPRDA
jgi:hypothetical protein